LRPSYPYEVRVEGNRTYSPSTPEKP